MGEPRGRAANGRHRRLAVVVAVALVVAVTGCGVDERVRPEAAAERRAPPTTTRSAARGPATTDPTVERSGTDLGGTGQVSLPDPDPLRWAACDDSAGSEAECAELAVPVDYGDPSAGDLTLALARDPADDPDRRIGSLMINPGGPGGSAVDLVAGNPLPPEITDRFDLVGMDPRGVGRSAPLDCEGDVAELYDADPSPDDGAERDRLVEVSAAYVEACRRRAGDLLAHVGTRNVARDMEVVRRALGEADLTYVGLSYGTSIGQQYAELFGDRVRAMVLDGVVDPAVDGPEAAATQAEGFEDALAAFTDDCAARSSCRLGDDPSAVVDEVMAAAEAAPIPAEGADRPATPGTVAIGTIAGLYHESRWPALEGALAKAADGDATNLVDLADDYLNRRRDGSYEGGIDAYFAVSCLDAAWPTDPDDLLDAARAADARAPHFGQATVSDYVRCPLWATAPQPLGPVTAPDAPKMMVVSTTNDPATPYENGVAVEQRLADAFLLTVEGNSHVAFLNGNDCVDTAVTDYLLDPGGEPATTGC